ncbi:hypothetical protein FO519_003530 [Halicephalobus sp. NKZ332]|nr:hypothetical protein FO519_003530 [Halicephalobus sp. NKZ332]
MMKSFLLVVLGFSAVSAFSCGSPKWSSSGYSTTDGFFHFDTTYITEFTLQCNNPIKDARFYAVVKGRAYQVAHSVETSNFQVSWQLPHGESGAQSFDIEIFDDEQFAARESALRNGDASSVKPLFTITQQHNGLSYLRTYYIETVATLLAFALLHYAHWCKTEIKDSFSNFKITMSQEEKATKKKEIEILQSEKAPDGLLAKFKFYFKRYWYIAVPVHFVCSLMWFSSAYILVKSGVDVIALLQMLHIPEALIEKVKNTPQTAGVLVIALILYKIATPLRYATTLAGIQVTFWTLRRLGKLKTAKEVEYKVRSGYEKYQRAIRRLNERRLANVTSKPSKKKYMLVLNQISRRMLSTEIMRKSLIAVTQLTCTHDKEQNFLKCKNMVERARELGCKMIFFPECTDYIGRNRQEALDLAENEEGSTIKALSELAKNNQIWISIGGFHNKKDASKHPYNTHLILNSEGLIIERYDKLHQFNLDIPGTRLLEREFSTAGENAIQPVTTPVGKIGMNICYDVRFPEMGIFYRRRGAHILTYPAAFTVPTGSLHWEVLLRSRAIENQCYVIAAAQFGVHNPNRISYGHAMVVDPNGAVVAQCSDKEDMIVANIDLDYLDVIRSRLNMIGDRRGDVYSINFKEKLLIENNQKFSNLTIEPDVIFYETENSFAFVNLKPVTSGHVLIAPKRVTQYYKDLSLEEVSDLMTTVQTVQKALVEYYKVPDCTITIQDGPTAGQTIPHVHVHLLPRRQGDFEDNEIYRELEERVNNRQPRSKPEMVDEASAYRKILYTV